MTAATPLLAIKYTPSPPSLLILDQLLLPHTSTYTQLKTTQDAWSAIRNMNVRGAPAIAIVAALALACELANPKTPFQSPTEAASFVRNALEYLLTSRPTAVNLADAAQKLTLVVSNAENAALDSNELGVQGAASVVKAYVCAAEQMLEDDKRDNLNIGKNGAEWILANIPQCLGKKVKVLTHCNTGSLATSGHGTALGIIRSLHSMDSLSHAYCTETRPYNQGSRLTAYELVHEKIPSTLVCDSACASLLRSQSKSQEGGIAAVVVGADRVAANGDTANKIGTYSLALLAKAHGALFVVAAPLTSIDLNMSSGDEIVIEERDPAEITCVSGLLIACSSSSSSPGSMDGGPSTKATIRVAAPGVNVWNPSFDVTPAHLIDAIVTERGVFVKRDGCDTFHLSQSLQH